MLIAGPSAVRLPLLHIKSDNTIYVHLYSRKNRGKCLFKLDKLCNKNKLHNARKLDNNEHFRFSISPFFGLFFFAIFRCIFVWYKRRNEFRKMHHSTSAGLFCVRIGIIYKKYSSFKMFKVKNRSGFSLVVKK